MPSCTTNNNVDDAGGDEGSPGCGSSLPTVPMPGSSSLLKIRYNDPNLGKVVIMMVKMMNDDDKKKESLVKIMLRTQVVLIFKI